MDVVGHKTNRMGEFQVSIPQEHYDLLNFTTDDLPGIAVVNSALKTFEPKEVFAWHLSVTLHLNELVEKGMPSRSEVEVIDAFVVILLTNSLKVTTNRSRTPYFWQG